MSDVVQGTPEWHALRCGRVTASKVADMLARTKTGWGAGRANYRAQLVCERLTGRVQDTFQSAAMLHGIETEAEACEAYAKHTLSALNSIGFVVHPAIEMAGASPDRLVGPDGLLEVKCPQPATHIETLNSKAVPSKYVTQIMWQLACMPDRKWADFVSYCPSFPESMRLFVARLHRDDDMIAELETEVAKFLAEVDATVAQLRAEYEPQLEAA